MNLRWVGALVIGALVFVMMGQSAAVAQAPAKKVIRIVATSFKFEPSLVEVRQGETVVLQLVNGDAVEGGRNHSINSQLFTMIPVTARGDIAAQGVQGDRAFWAFAPGKQIEVEFTASTRGSFTFVCGIGNHAAQGQVGAINVLPASP